jgi:DNA polymerase/3'-5' exonuclease PolX
MTNREIAAVLFNISAILDTQHGNPYRIRAYRRAALNLLRLRTPVADRVAAGKPLGLPRLGKSLTAKISALASKDALPFYEELCEALPAEERTLLKLKVPGLGPTIAARIHHDLGSTDPASLRRAVATGKLQKVWGIGPKRTAAILDAVGGMEIRQERMEL